MDIGLYKLKDKAREFLSVLLPLFKNIDPNHISYSMIPVGISTSFCFYWAKECLSLYLLAMLLMFLRMVIATLDGYVAVQFNKPSAKGDYINKMIPEICDAILLGSLLYIFEPTYKVMTIFVLLGAWLTSFFGLVGLMIQLPVVSVGPTGQTDRLFALMLCTFGMYLSELLRWDLNFMNYFYMWCIVGGALTILNRFWHTLKKIPY